MEYRLLPSTESSQFPTESFDVNLTVAVSPIETAKIAQSGLISYSLSLCFGNGASAVRTTILVYKDLIEFILNIFTKLT